MKWFRRTQPGAALRRLAHHGRTGAGGQRRRRMPLALWRTPAEIQFADAPLLAGVGGKHHRQMLRPEFELGVLFGPLIEQSDLPSEGEEAGTWLSLVGA